MLRVFLFQLLSAGVSQYPSLYSSPAHAESGKWDALVKASESLLKEKELIIERQVLMLYLGTFWDYLMMGKLGAWNALYFDRRIL